MGQKAGNESVSRNMLLLYPPSPACVIYFLFSSFFVRPISSSLVEPLLDLSTVLYLESPQPPIFIEVSFLFCGPHPPYLHDEL